MALTVRTSRCAAIGVVSELMNVEATLCIGVVAGEVPGDGGWGRFGSLLEGDGSSDL